MDTLRKPQKVFKKFVSKVSIQTVVKNGSNEDVGPLRSSRVRDEWPLPSSVDFRDPKVSHLFILNLFPSFFLLGAY
jgi:hypothetical protein